MHVTEIRRSLQFIRKEWSRHSILVPFNPSATVPDIDISTSQFAFEFMASHHRKRLRYHSNEEYKNSVQELLE